MIGWPPKAGFENLITPVGWPLRLRLLLCEVCAVMLIPVCAAFVFEITGNGFCGGAAGLGAPSRNGGVTLPVGA